LLLNLFFAFSIIAENVRPCFMKWTNLLSRLATVTLFLVLLVLTGFSIWIARLNQQASSETQETSLLRRINYALSTEESTQYEYVLWPSPALRKEHLADANTLITLFYQLQQESDPDDRTLAQQLLREETHYLFLSGQFFAAVDAHDLTRARMIHYRNIDPVFDHIQQQIQQEADQTQALGVAASAQLSQLLQLTFIVTPALFASGLVGMTAIWWITRSYRRKVNEVVLAEKTHREQLVFTDPLTDLGNHHAYQEHLCRALAQDRHSGKRLLLALLDLDEFKVFNEVQGHLRGDEVLRAFADLLREVGLPATAFRLSGDDFALILSQSSLIDVTFALERLREDVERSSLGITLSIGMAETMSEESNRELLHAQASAALQEAKRRGRNRLLTFEEIESRVSLVSSAKIQAVHHVLSEGKMTVAFQPIWNLATGSLLAFEALARSAADYGFAGPQELFDLAEQIGRAHELDGVCLQAILARAAELPADTLLFVNLTPQSLVYDLLAGATLLEAVVAAGLTPSRVVLEMTERSIVQLEEVIQKVKSLRLMGFRVALDDTGAGNAGLEMLSQLPIDFVKIDRTVVGRALTDQAAHSVLAGLATIARESHIGVVAEGIESPEMLDLVQQLQVHYAQGYYLGHPSGTIPETSALQEVSQLLSTSSHEMPATT
jgi:diguanylate cyclase (GGDEF)-like protein